MSIYDRIKEAGLSLPVHTPVRAAFKPFNRHGNLLVISGQLPVRDGKAKWTGSVPEVVSVEG